MMKRERSGLWTGALGTTPADRDESIPTSSLRILGVTSGKTPNQPLTPTSGHLRPRSRPGELSEYLEVKGYADAAEWVYGQAIEPEYESVEPLTLTELRRVHTLAMQPVWDVPIGTHVSTRGLGSSVGTTFIRSPGDGAAFLGARRGRDAQLDFGD